MRLILLIGSFILIASVTEAQFSGGSGTDVDPWQVATLDDLQDVGDHAADYFIQTDDIDAADTETWNEGEGFEPIVDFSGLYDGNGFGIENLIINRPDSINVGLFGSVLTGGVIENVTLVNAIVAGNEEVGILAGANSGEIISSSSSGEVTGESHVGGLVGFNDGGEIIDSHSSADITAGGRAGGLVGQMEGGLITSSYATGSVADISGDNRFGGLVGIIEVGVISDSYATGAVSGSNHVGGLTGQSWDGEISNSYSLSNVSGNNHVGGLIGRNRDVASVVGSYASGAVTGGDGNNVGGFIGTNDGGTTVESSYWNTDLTAVGIYDGSPDGATGLTAEEMTGNAAVDNMTDFDFVNVWQPTNSFPALYWQDVQAPIDIIFAGGSGTEEDPWQIADLEQLQEIAAHALFMESHFIQTADIDASETATWNEGEGFSPIVHDGVAFNGSFDGNGFVIQHLTINRTAQNEIGLFADVDTLGVIDNVALENVSIVGFEWVGALAGRSKGLITNSYSTGELSGESDTGGLVGRLDEGTISDSYSSVSVTTGGRGGGLVGQMFDGLIERSHATGDVTEADGNHRLGGFIGILQGGEINDSYAAGNVSGTNHTGGFVGQNWDGVINNSYTLGDVSGNNHTGGFVGRNRDNAVISGSYSSGVVMAGGSNTAGFVGTLDFESTVESSYWNTDATPIGVASGLQSGFTGLSEAQMTGNAAVENMTDFDFENVWQPTNSFPALHWQDVDPVTVPDTPAVAVLTAPANGSNDVTFPITFEWESAEHAEFYTLQVSTDNDFSDIIVEESNIDGTSLELEDDSEFEVGTEYFWRVQSANSDLTADWSSVWFFNTAEATYADDRADIPEVITLDQNYPNPFNPSTSIRFGLPQTENVQLDVYNLLGQRVATLVNGSLEAGYHTTSFNGGSLSSGIYLYRLQAGDVTEIKQMMLIK